MQIPSVGTFQDGAMAGGGKHNNPINLAVWESRCLWPSLKPDVVLSLGTGTRDAGPPQTTGVRNIWKDGWAPRVKRSVESAFDGQHAWGTLWNHLDDQARQNYFRLNLAFPGSEPSADDADCMEDLARCVQVQPCGRGQRDDVLSALLISCLFFELDGMPRYECGFYYCTGFIRCKVRSHALIKALLCTHAKDIDFYDGNHHLGVKISLDDICTACYRYQRPIQFLKRSLEDPIELSVHWGDTCHRKLSGMPHTLSSLIDKQSLDSPFGTAAHDIPRALHCPPCANKSYSFKIPIANRKRLIPLPKSPALPSRKRQNVSRGDGL
jgi:hypothetical protein